MSLGTQESRRDVLSAHSKSPPLMLKASMKVETATAVLIGFVGATGPSAETDSKQKQIIITKQNGVRDNNPRITWYYIQRGLTPYNQTDP